MTELNTTRARKTTAAASPLPKPITAADVLDDFRGTARRIAKDFTTQRAKFSAGVAESADLSSAIYWDAAPLVKQQVVAAVHALAVENLEDPEYAGPGLRERLVRLGEQARYECESIIGCQSWNKNSSNPISNVLEAAKVNGRLAAWRDLAETIRFYLGREIAEDTTEAVARTGGTIR